MGENLDNNIAEALIELSDLANAVAGDFHCLHLNVQGAEFDTFHSEVLKKYYEEAAEDYDSFAESACMFGIQAPNPNGSAGRIEYESYEPDGFVSRKVCVIKTKELLDRLLGQYLMMFKVLNKIDNCARSVGIANLLQTRIEYWSKEAFFFNKGRVGE